MNFSTNQARQLYVANAFKATAVDETDAVGTISVHEAKAGNEIYFLYRGVDGVSRTDLINKSQILYANATDASFLGRKLKKVKVSLDANINSGAPVAGQDYILRLTFREYIGLSPEDQYFKYGMVHATASMTAEQFYQTLKASLEKNMSREVSKLLNFSYAGVNASAAMATNTGITVTAKEVGTAGNSLKFAIDDVAAAEAGVTVATVSGVTTITASLTGTAKTIGDLKDLIAASEAADLITISGTDATAVVAEVTAVALAGGSTTGLYIEEAEQPWQLGVIESLPVNFTVTPDEIKVGGLDVVWGVTEDVTPTTTLGNGKTTADLEYFCMGERGDVYRNVGFPYVIKTTYLVDPTKAYNHINLHFYYVGSNEMVQKSEKDLTIVVPKEGDNNAAGNALANSIIGAINTAAGLTIPTLATT